MSLDKLEADDNKLKVHDIDVNILSNTADPRFEDAYEVCMLRCMPACQQACMPACLHACMPA